MTWNQVVDLSGVDGTPGADGVSVIDASIDPDDGHLFIELSNGVTIDAGPARGAPGGGIDFESSVQSVADLPGSAAYGEARFVRDDGHLYVFEAGDDRTEGVDGWTDVGPIRGEQGDPGADGADGSDGVSVTDATVNGSGVLVLTLSNNNTITAGTVVGPKGDKGDTGDAGSPGTDGLDGERAPGVYGGAGDPPTDETPYIVGDYWFDEASGAVWKKNN